MNTFDYYTGAAYGTETGVNSEEIVNIPYTNSTHLAPSTYSNDTIAWNLEYNNPIVGGFTPMSAYQFNITFYSDPDYNSLERTILILIRFLRVN